MSQSKKIAGITMVVGIVSAIPFMWYIYLKWYYEYASRSTWMPILMGGALLSTILMFGWKVKHGQRGELQFFMFDLGVSFPAGFYPLGNALPFLREIDFIAGFGLAPTENGRRVDDRDVNIRHRQDPSATNYLYRTTGTSAFWMNLDKGLGKVLSWFFDWKAGHDEWQYYRVGRTVYIFMWLAAFFAVQLSPNSNASSSETNVSTSLSQLVYVGGEEAREMEVQLSEGPAPVIPPPELFTSIGGETARYVVISGRKYVLFTEAPIGMTRALEVNESLCAVIPFGQTMVFMTRYRPQYAYNMVNSVTYSRSSSSLTVGEKYMAIGFRKLITGEDYRIQEKKSWHYIHNNWNKVDGQTFGLLVRAVNRNTPNKKIAGGVVCF